MFLYWFIRNSAFGPRISYRIAAFSCYLDSFAFYSIKTSV
jgi:hypothetical protein